MSVAKKNRDLELNAFTFGQEPSSGTSIVGSADPDVVVRRFEADYASGKFNHLEGQWAAYVNGTFVKTDEDGDRLFDDISRQFRDADIVIQPIEPVLMVKLGSRF